MTYKSNKGESRSYYFSYEIHELLGELSVKWGIGKAEIAEFIIRTGLNLSLDPCRNVLKNLIESYKHDCNN